jgi:endonuclease/exonuclease/phosphatase family metal-dependent hydrolase
MNFLHAVVYLSVFVVLSLSLLYKRQQRPSRYRLAFFNVANSHLEANSVTHTYAVREPLVAADITKAKPDVLCLSEIAKSTTADESHTFSPIEVCDRLTLQTESNCNLDRVCLVEQTHTNLPFVFYKATFGNVNRVTHLKTITLWALPADSTAPLDASKRGMSVLFSQFKTMSGVHFWVVNCHFPTRMDDKEKVITAINDNVLDITGGELAFLGGDLNLFKQDQEKMRALLSMMWTELTLSLGDTWSAFPHDKGVNREGKLDAVFALTASYKQELVQSQAGMIAPSNASDHRLIFVDVCI